MATTVYWLWSRNKGVWLSQYPSSADATAAARRLQSKSDQLAGKPGHFVADTIDVVSVTKN